MEMFRKDTIWKAYTRKAKGRNIEDKTEVKKGTKSKS